jgi:hypothetical protein
MLSSPSLRAHPVTEFNNVQDVLRGSVRNAHLRYGFQMRWDGEVLAGRLGGRFIGEHLRLQGNANELLGMVTGGVGHLAVRAFSDADKLHLRVVGPSGELNAEADLRRGVGVLHHGGSSSSFVVQRNTAQLNLTFSDTESVQQSGVGNASNGVCLTAALLAVIVAREINRAQLESLREMGEL